MTFAIRTIMLATDFSEASEAAAAYAFRLARALAARLIILHVVPEDDVQVLVKLSQHLHSHITPDTLREVLYTDADKRLAQLVADADIATLVQERLIVTGKPADDIISWVASTQADLLIIGTHRRTGFDHFLLGSVAERVVRQAPCSVVVVPAQSPGEG